MMVALAPDERPAAYSLYLTEKLFFPLVAAVLLNVQDGTVYADSVANPSQVYVEHSFGFGQIFGASNTDFENSLEHYLLTVKSFRPSKIRLYCPNIPNFLAPSQFEPLRSSRQRFRWTEADATQRSVDSCPQRYSIGEATQDNIGSIASRLGVVNRFWRTPECFVSQAKAAVIFYDDAPVAICYSAAEAGQRTEIDVLTLPEHRLLGLGRIAVSYYVKNGKEAGIEPLWDCYTNNVGSMALCRSSGFMPVYEPYAFFTIPR